MNNTDKSNKDFSLNQKIVTVLDSTMNYVDIGSGEPIVFLHGNPTSSYLWRNIIPFLLHDARCFAPDLIGMGKSGKSENNNYGFSEQSRYLDEWFNLMDFESPITLVLHDWGSALGFYWAYRYQTKVKAIIYMESIVQPRIWSDFPDGRDKIFKLLRSDEGKMMAFDDNFFVETLLPKSVIRELSNDEMTAYLLPFLIKENRKPTLDLAIDLPIEGEPAHVAQIVDEYGQWLLISEIPKLLIVAKPGALLTGRNLEFARSFPNQIEISVSGIHYIQEDSPEEIGKGIKEFYLNLKNR